MEIERKFSKELDADHRMPNESFGVTQSWLRR